LKTTVKCINKKIFCCIPWTEYCDYPLARKLIKDKLSRCMAHIRVVIPSFPNGIGLTQEEADEFYDWLKNDLNGFATVERLTSDQAPRVTKWSGNADDSTFNHFYVYQFEHCIDQCEYDYIARIETDFDSDDWDKIEKIIDEDFDLITVGMGATHRHGGDVSFTIFKRDLLLNIEDLTFNMVTQRKIHYDYDVNSEILFGENSNDYILFDRNTCLLNMDEQYRYDIFQWSVFRCIENSNKVYLINPNKINLEHYVGMTQQYFTFRRMNVSEHSKQVADQDNRREIYASMINYIQKMKRTIDIDNYNLFTPYKKLIEKFCNTYDM